MIFPKSLVVIEAAFTKHKASLVNLALHLRITTACVHRQKFGRNEEGISMYSAELETIVQRLGYEVLDLCSLNHLHSNCQ